MDNASFSALLDEINVNYQNLIVANGELRAEVARLQRSSSQDFLEVPTHSPEFTFETEVWSPSPAVASPAAEVTCETEVTSLPVSNENAGAADGVVEHTLEKEKPCLHQARTPDRIKDAGITRPNPIGTIHSTLRRALTQEIYTGSPQTRPKRRLSTLPGTPTHLMSAEYSSPDNMSGLTSFESNLSERVKRASDELENRDRPIPSFHLKWQGSSDRNSSSKRSALDMLKEKGVKANLNDIIQPFDIFSGVVIITYVLFLGFETEVLSRRLTDFNGAFFILHMIYNVYFFIEVIVRIWSYRRNFFIGPGWRLNLLDVLLVASAVVDLGITTESSSSARMLRSIRVVRLVRTVRIVRAMRDIREFQKMVFAITSSMKTLAYSIVILFFILYFFSVVFTYGAMEARDWFQDSPLFEHDDHILHELELYWGTFSQSIYSCYLSVSAGQSWFFVIKPLSKYSTVLTLCFIGFISLTLFGVLNAITAIFVESSLMSAQHYKDLIILDKNHERELAMNHIREVFRQIDQDGSGEISAPELDFFLANDALRKYMEALNITTEDTHMLFRLLDIDQSGVVDFEEFCAGCMRLKGEARAFDVQVLLLQLRHFVEQWSKFTSFVADELGNVGENFDTMKRSLVTNSSLPLHQMNCPTYEQSSAESACSIDRNDELIRNSVVPRGSNGDDGANLDKALAESTSWNRKSYVL